MGGVRGVDAGRRVVDAARRGAAPAAGAVRVHPRPGLVHHPAAGGAGRAGEFLRAVQHGRLADRLLFATDYPHWDFDSPAQSLPGELSKEARAAILAGNACDLYGLPREREVAGP
ncbi:MAG TPA: amidohydrolase family protein [Candidatus Dormibacteraeota bacterium]